MLKQEWNRLIIAFVGVGLFFIFVLAIFFSEEFQECYNAENCSYFDNQYECEPPLPHGVFRRAAECTWDVIHSNAEPILAVFTIVLAIFTFALWRATLRLAEDASTAMRNPADVGTRLRFMSVCDYRINRYAMLTHAGKRLRH